MILRNDINVYIQLHIFRYNLNMKYTPFDDGYLNLKLYTHTFLKWHVNISENKYSNKLLLTFKS